ncbi:DUF5954 family protein [Actinomadura rudentiformis]|uniref:PE-PGRS family protein n=1 Tax=Actinomadura rudentiformis TaxID=359158 RepID=A0A6H9YVQ0_9ACTN|nr:DUF5954 family protein [Actinomadura rudentiformis]KAB2351357.1 hypothetical protein F8566_03610 [Actinomadura rudentiformis]
MPFPLMPGYDHINLVADLDPVAAVRDEETGERIRRFPKLIPAGSPDFGYAVQTGTEWRIGCTGASDPAGARYDLARDLRMEAEHENDAEVVHAMRAAAEQLDPPEGRQLPKDEWEIGERRYRVIRIEKFTLIHQGVMEPPRVTDSDTPEADPLLRGLLIQPRAPAGQWEAQLRLNLVGYIPKPGSVPDEIMVEAGDAIRRHAGVVLLPPTFTVLEILGTAAKPITGGNDPREARSRLAGYFTNLLPGLREFQGDPASAAELAEWKHAAEQIEATNGHAFNVLGRRFCTIRVSRMLRLGRDGPEAPRGSDQARYGLQEPDTG